MSSALGRVARLTGALALRLLVTLLVVAIACLGAYLLILAVLVIVT